MFVTHVPHEIVDKVDLYWKHLTTKLEELKANVTLTAGNFWLNLDKRLSGLTAKYKAEGSTRIQNKTELGEY